MFCLPSRSLLLAYRLLCLTKKEQFHFSNREYRWRLFSLFFTSPMKKWKLSKSETSVHVECYWFCISFHGLKNYFNSFFPNKSWQCCSQKYSPLAFWSEVFQYGWNESVCIWLVEGTINHTWADSILTAFGSPPGLATERTVPALCWTLSLSAYMTWLPQHSAVLWVCLLAGVWLMMFSQETSPSKAIATKTTLLSPFSRKM